jgi:hypothetical protein
VFELLGRGVDVDRGAEPGDHLVGAERSEHAGSQRFVSTIRSP